VDEETVERVREAVRSIPPGETATYGEIARAIGDPGAARAVGAALGSNPFPIVVPCHRVLAADGALHGFSAPGGIATKRRMLEIECAPGFTQASLFG
jgi:methylated-DNA-[protein]-cysteine S-methyltransferase